MRTNDKKQYRTKVDSLIRSWLNERQELILLLCAVNGLKEYTPDETPVEVKIQAFCQVLIDYISAGHFEVYKALWAECKSLDGQDFKAARALSRKLEQSTELALAFNDDFDTPEHCQQLRKLLPRQLSELGERLEERFELEDKLIALLHGACDIEAA